MRVLRGDTVGRDGVVDQLECLLHVVRGGIPAAPSTQPVRRRAGVREGSAAITTARVTGTGSGAVAPGSARRGAAPAQAAASLRVQRPERDHGDVLAVGPRLR